MKKGLLLSALVGLTLASVLILTGCGSNATTSDSATTTEDTATTTQESAGTTTLPTVDELKVEDLKKGSGKKAETGNVLTVVYKGTLTDGTEFDSNTKENPFQFTLGTGEVIEGWDEGMQGMQVGGKRKLTIPASMAYGDEAVGTIPGGSTLIFEVELLAID